MNKQKCTGRSVLDFEGEEYVPVSLLQAEQEKCKRLLVAIDKIDEQICIALINNDFVSVGEAGSIIIEALKEATSAEGEA